MTDVYIQDKTYRTAAHLSVEECEVLINYHQKRVTVLTKKIDLLRYKSDGRATYSEKIDTVQGMINYHQYSIQKAKSICNFLNSLNNES